MKRFLIKIALFIIALLSFYILFVHKLSEDHVDEFYNKFTQEASGLILGISKASKGINPEIIETKLDELHYDTPIINFALNVANSQYGDAYFEAIKKKLNPIAKKKLFIISVSPGSFATPKSYNDEDIIKHDKKTIVGKVTNVKSKPNYNYIIKTYDKPLYNALHKYDQWSHHKTHNNGWLEIRLATETDTFNDSRIKEWKSHVKKYFEENMKKQKVSNYRIISFIKILSFLKNKGDVFLVSIPEDQSIMNIEQAFWPNFESTIDSIAKQYNVPFFNYSHLVDTFKTYDGLHFDSNGAKEFSSLLSDDIKKYLKESTLPLKD